MVDVYNYFTKYHEEILPVFTLLNSEFDDTIELCILVQALFRNYDVYDKQFNHLSLFMKKKYICLLKIENFYYECLIYSLSPGFVFLNFADLVEIVNTRNDISNTEITENRHNYCNMCNIFTNIATRCED